MLGEKFAYPSLMHYFEAISAIPRPSYHEEKIADYLVAFAEERGLAYHRDSTNNVLINLPASKGYESKSPILFQGHTDMVCEKNEGVPHDFLRDSLKLYEKDGWIRAAGTTLGADNGVAIAAMLALLDGASEEHPALQCLFTSSEEVGLDGAKAFDYSRIYARKMLNMDSADEHTITVGCAGGLRSTLTLPARKEACVAPLLKLRVTGLAGGHSGEDIHRGRANANKVMGRVLWTLSEEFGDLRLVSIHGGTKDNAIPRESEAVVCVENREGAMELVERISKEIKAELFADDRGFTLTAEPIADAVGESFDRESTETIAFLLVTVANGVFETNPALSGLVEFSRNLGIVDTVENGVEVIFSSRSGRDSQIDASAASLDAYAKRLGGTVRHYNRYPGWAYAEDSEIRREYTAAYRKLYGKDPKVEVIHAGLECGIIKEAIPDMDMLSCGPVVLDLHSPDEALNKDSFERFFGLILEILKN